MELSTCEEEEEGFRKVAVVLVVESLFVASKFLLGGEVLHLRNPKPERLHVV